MMTRRLVTACAVLTLAACEHSTPFEDPAPVTNPPRGDGPVYRVTFNVADDRTVSWLPDGAGFIYSTEREDRTDHDRCLATQPAAGGTIMRLACNRAPGYDDSTDVWESPAVNEDGDLLYLRTVSRIGRQKRDFAELMIAPAENPADARSVILLPYTAEEGRLHSSLAEVRWLSPERFVYLGQRLIFEGSTFFPDTFITGVDIVEVTLSGGTPTRRLVPGTRWASSVSAGDDGQTIYYTLGGDSRVYRQALATGAVEVVHDFGAEGIARGAQVRGNRLVAVVGGSVLFRDEGVLEMVQRDEGGHLYVADLASGETLRLTSSAETLFHRPALSPDGTRLAAEAAPFAPVHDEVDSEFNAPNHRHDIWLFDLP
jgi:hypothetical protein